MDLSWDDCARLDKDDYTAILYALPCALYKNRMEWHFEVWNVTKGRMFKGMTHDARTSMEEAEAAISKFEEEG